jgi:hypothetical protein
LRTLANTLNGQVTIVHNAAKKALLDIDALDLVEAHLKGPPDSAEAEATPKLRRSCLVNLATLIYRKPLSHPVRKLVGRLNTIVGQPLV